MNIFAKMNLQKTSEVEKLSHIQVHSVHQDPDWRQPWSHKTPYTSLYTGTFIKDPFSKELVILIPAQALVHSIQIWGELLEDGHKIEFKKHLIDYERNIAFLKLKNYKLNSARIRPISLGSDPIAGASLAAFSVVGQRKIHRLKPTLLSYDMSSVETSLYYSPRGLIKLTGSVKNGTPVYRGKKLVGMIVGFDGHNHKMLPISLIKFALQQKKVKKPPFIGLIADPLRSAAMKESLGFQEKKKGALVTKILQMSDLFKRLAPSSILVQIGKHKINQEAQLNHSKWGDLHYSAGLAFSQPSDKISMHFFSEKITTKHIVKLKAFDSDLFPIPAYINKDDAPHMIFAGLVFQELSMPYLRSYGANWHAHVQSDFLNLFAQYNEYGSKQRHVILNHVLSDSINASYDRWKNIRITHINGGSIHSLKEAYNALMNPLVVDGKKYARFQFDLSQGEMIIAYENIEDSHQRIKEIFNIPPSSFFPQVELSREK